MHLDGGEKHERLSCAIRLIFSTEYYHYTCAENTRFNILRGKFRADEKISKQNNAKYCRN